LAAVYNPFFHKLPPRKGGGRQKQWPGGGNFPVHSPKNKTVGGGGRGEKKAGVANEGGGATGPGGPGVFGVAEGRRGSPHRPRLGGLAGHPRGFETGPYLDPPPGAGVF